MGSLRDQVVARYAQAAGVIGGTSPSNEARTKDQGEDPAQVDSDAKPVALLLARQARRLLEFGELSQKTQLDRDAECQRLVQIRLDDLASICMSKFYSYRYDKLPYFWRQAYTESLILKTHHHVLTKLFDDDRGMDGSALDAIVGGLDRAVITAGGAGKLGASWIEETLRLLGQAWEDSISSERPAKRHKTSAEPAWSFSSHEPFGRPSLLEQRACHRMSDWSIEKFEDYMNEGHGNPRPLVFTDLMQDWPAITGRPWKSPDYLLAQTFGGRRLVPVEIGRSYVDEGWGQQLLPFKDFLSKYVDVADTISPDCQVGYLAQHNLFQQIPSLRNDIQVPDLCWATVPPHPTDPSKNQEAVDVPRLNAWFGPARTITPLHTDGYHNLLCQVVGTKYVRLYPPSATTSLWPRGIEDGIDMSNTSKIDLGLVEGWDVAEDHEEEMLGKMKSDLHGLEYWECVLAPGETLLIPIGWWHYVRSLSVSFSVSFWWN